MKFSWRGQRGREGRRHLLADLACLASCSALLAPSRALATYSLIASDPGRAEVGAAGASCVPYEVIEIYESAPSGALVAQANFDVRAQATGLELLSAGESAASVLSVISDARSFPQAPKMQYGVVDVKGGIATFTGPEALPVAKGREREVGELRVAALGNVLTSEALLDQALAGFESDGCDLAERLLHGLEAADDGGQGDNRCTPEGRPANSAFLDVTGPSGSVVRISVPDVSPESPIPALRAAFEEWRADHPCPELPPGSGGGNGPGGGGTGGDAAGASPEDGCDCRASGAPSSDGAPALLPLVALLARRRRRR